MTDLTLDEIRVALADGIAANAAFDGWTPAARDMAADSAGIDRDVAALALPDAMTMIDAWFAAIDAAMIAALPADDLATMKIRDRIAVDRSRRGWTRWRAIAKRCVARWRSWRCRSIWPPPRGSAGARST